MDMQSMPLYDDTIFKGIRYHYQQALDNQNGHICKHGLYSNIKNQLVSSI